MSYTANQYNYATPLSSAAGLMSQYDTYVDAKYFTLSGNKLDGSYIPISGDVGIWGSSLSGADGALAEHFILRVEKEETINAFRLRGSYYSYPTVFTVEFYNGESLIYTINELDNKLYDYVYYFGAALHVTSYVITISSISTESSVVRLLNIRSPYYLKRAETFSLAANSTSFSNEQFRLLREDYPSVGVHEDESSLVNILDVKMDTALVSVLENSVLTNIHSVMKDTSRRVYGKVYVTYTDPLLDDLITVDASGTAYNSSSLQLYDGVIADDTLYFTLYENDLSGRYLLSNSDSQTGWTSSEVSDANGYFNNDVHVTLNFSARPIVSLPIHFGSNCTAEEFTVTLIKEDNTSVVKHITDNNEYSVDVIDEAISDVVAVTIQIEKVSKAYYPITIVDVPLMSTVLYVGYQGVSNLINIDMLEELTYEDDVEALGGVSANKLTVTFDNSKQEFYFNNPRSLVARRLHRNRKIVPWLGAEVSPGTIEWYSLGTFWSHKWDVAVGSLTASVTAFDTIGLLDTSPFTKHHVLVDATLGHALDYILTDAKETFSFLEWSISDELYEEVIPYIWFANGSHAAALRKVAQAYPMHIYCDRQGRVCAAPQKLKLDFYYDTWSDDTNVIEKSYTSLNTALPNVINIKVIMPVVLVDEELVKDTLTFNVEQLNVRQLNFGKPYVSGLVVTVDKDSSVSYTYDVYSWGIALNFTGTGSVYGIRCTGNALDTSNSSVITTRDENSIRLNGTIKRDIEADFIQTTSLANYIMSRLMSLSANDKYDAEVTYRGDIALSINDPILLLNGIAPDNRYNIKRHQLTWDGSLTGSAYLNT